MKRPALQNKRVAVLGMALRARKVFGTFEKRALGQIFEEIPAYITLAQLDLGPSMQKN